MNYRLAVVTTHPIQYYAPWFRHIAKHCKIDLKVFYLWNPQATSLHDPGFGREVNWDVPLLEGYQYEFVPNTSTSPGSCRFWGIRNADLGERIGKWKPDAALLIGYRYASMFRLILAPARQRGFPLLFRGDSHRLTAEQLKTQTLTAEIEKRKKGSGKRKGESGNFNAEVKRRAIAAIYSRFAAFLYVGKANREYFLHQSVPERKLFFAPHAVENERFWLTETTRIEGQRWREELGVPAECLLILFAGKFEKKKRPLDLLHAFARLKSQNAALLFVGSGEMEAEVRQAAKKVPRVFFAPFQNQSLMPRTYAAADLFVLPSSGKEETWGLAINEALCAECPVIVSDLVGCGPDLVTPEVNGLVFKAQDVDSLADTLRHALSDRRRLAKWGEAGRRLVATYDYSRATRGLEEAMDKVVGSAWPSATKRS